MALHCTSTVLRARKLFELRMRTLAIQYPDPWGKSAIPNKENSPPCPGWGGLILMGVLSLRRHYSVPRTCESRDSYIPWTIGAMPLRVSDFHFPTSNFHFPTSIFQFPFSDFQFHFPTSIFHFPISNFHFPTSIFDFQLPFSISVFNFTFPFSIYHYNLPNSHYNLPNFLE